MTSVARSSTGENATSLVASSVASCVSTVPLDSPSSQVGLSSYPPISALISRYRVNVLDESLLLPSLLPADSGERASPPTDAVGLTRFGGRVDYAA